jgi:transcription antitermination protein NusB
MGKRRHAREIALQALYRLDLNPGPAEMALADSDGFREAPENLRGFARALVEGVLEKKGAIDAVIEGASLHWPLARMAVVDRNVLRLAALEMMLFPETPARVVLNEAIELAKTFGGEESGTFVNGLLDRIRVDLKREDV